MTRRAVLTVAEDLQREGASAAPTGLLSFGSNLLRSFAAYARQSLARGGS